jgi:thiamine biosynthesis lipoprotein
VTKELIEFGFEFSAMASHCEVRVGAPDEAAARAWADAAIAEVRRIEAKYSRYRDDSVTAAINRWAGVKSIDVDDETAALLDFADALWRQSGGLFDLTSGVLRRAWNFEQGRIPSESELAQLLPLVGWGGVQWRRPTLRLPRVGMELDFGGIGKEYAADRAAAALEQHGGRRGFVNLGGDVRGIGPQLDGSPWNIGIQHPRRPAGELIGAIGLTKQAVATSGDYERYFEAGGRRYCHILDPRTGWPVSYWQSISVAAPVCVAAGSCTTIAMLKPVDEALAFLRSQGAEFLAVAANGVVYRS